MGKYLKKFETMTAYTAAQSSLILPNVSLIADSDVVVYNQTEPTPSHEYVEIDGIKWATMNLGANSVTDYGMYYAWGDTQGYAASQIGNGEGKMSFDWSTYKYAEITTSPASTAMTKYNDTDGLTALEASDDAVVAAWGGNWRMPTNLEYKSLISATTSVWTDDYQGTGVGGVILTDNTDSSKVLFFPASGMGSYGVWDTNQIISYWSKTLYFGNSGSKFSASYGGSLDYNASEGRRVGFAIRGILDE